MAADRDFYTLLGVPPDAPTEAVKRAYRKLAVELHPDRNRAPAAEERFKEITLAYQTLSTAARRKRYDEERRRASAKLVLWKGPPHRARGEDLTYRLEVTFEEGIKGTVRGIEFRRKATCGECGGSGAALERAPSRIPPCADCGGRGKIDSDGRRPRACERCRGRGLEPIEACAHCEGEGRRQQVDGLDVPVPAGIESGRRLRLAGWGDDGPANGEAGNLLVVVTVSAHALLQRDGADLHCDVPISFTEALLGTELRIPSVDGVLPLAVPAGASDGTVLRVKGMGVPAPDGRRGDLIVKLAVVYPTSLSAEQREALASFSRTRPPEDEPRVADFRQAVRRLYDEKA